MIVLHIESGLGNQMLSYCEYIAAKQANPNCEIYIETITYEIPECNDIICQWNGYEVDRIFGLRTPNIKDQFSPAKWESIIEDVRTSKFWLRNWNWPVCIKEALETHGIKLTNYRGNFEEKGHSIVAVNPNAKLNFWDKLREKDWYKYIKLKKDHYRDKKRSARYSNEHIHFMQIEEDVFNGHHLTFKFIGSGIERIADEVRRTFSFPSHKDKRNLDCEQLIQNCNSIAIHARRGDLLGYNYDCYRFGYFKRCVKFIRKKVSNPVFFIFCDSGSVQWAKENAEVFGLDFAKDQVHFVDWNKGEDSYRDMQLMAQCKHQIITRSSFGWWGAWLNTNPDKITCSPDILINTTHHF